RLADLNSGSAQPSLNRNFLYPLLVKRPPLDAQQRVAGILSAYDDLIEVNTRRIAILEEIAHRLFDEWFAKFRRQVGDRTEEWPVTTIGAVCNSLTDGDWIETKDQS